MNFKTIITESKLKINNNTFYIKHENLIPFGFGGNKMRIASCFIEDMYRKKNDCIIGYGSVKSNLSRALACMCSSQGIPCSIISSVNENEVVFDAYNSEIVKQMGADVIICRKNNVHETVEKVIDSLNSNGFSPYYIYGDSFGNGNEITPLYAYFLVYNEIKKQSEEICGNFDYIFVACGTGMTYSGLLCGKLTNNGKEKIVGISIAREKEIQIQKIKKMVELFAEKEKLDLSKNWLDNNIIFSDEYLCGGYSKYNSDIEKIILDEMKTDGIAFDPTYTGKAFWGMCEFLKKYSVSGKKILFINTGATTLYFDYLDSIKQDVSIPLFCNNHNEVLEFLEEIDCRLPISLKSRVDLNQYAEKVINKGKIIAFKNKENKIISAVLFYCNDNVKKDVYITLFGTLEGYEGKGYGKKIMETLFKYSIELNMKRIILDTESSNIKAINFYKRNGFIIQSTENKIHMIKEL